MRCVKLYKQGAQTADKLLLRTSLPMFRKFKVRGLIHNTAIVDSRLLILGCAMEDGARHTLFLVQIL